MIDGPFVQLMIGNFRPTVVLALKHCNLPLEAADGNHISVERISPAYLPNGCFISAELRSFGKGISGAMIDIDEAVGVRDCKLCAVEVVLGICLRKGSATMVPEVYIAILALICSFSYDLPRIGQ
jgi:hypothetical protein